MDEQVKLEPSYSVWHGLKKAGGVALSTGLTIAVIAGPALLDHFSDEHNLAPLFARHPELLGLVPVVAGAVRFLANYLRQRNRLA